MALRVYYLPNLDGVHSALVAAANQREAVKLMRTTLGEFRRYGGRRLDPTTSAATTIAVAMSEPGRVWKRKIEHGIPQPWVYAFVEDDAGTPVTAPGSAR